MIEIVEETAEEFQRLIFFGRGDFFLLHDTII